MCISEILGGIFGDDEPDVAPPPPAPTPAQASEAGKKVRQRRATAIGRDETIRSDLRTQDDEVRGRKTALGA